MPLRHPPPPASPVLVPGNNHPPGTTCASDVDATSEKLGRAGGNVRQKRKRDDEDLKELKSLISCLSIKVDENFDDIKRKNEELKESLQFVSDQYDTIIKTLERIESERHEDRRTIQRLEERIEFLERKNRSTSIEIRNVPLILRNNKKYESKEDTHEIIKSLSKTIEVELQDSDIKDIYRTATHKDGNKPIMVELNSAIKKEKLIQGVKNFNRNKQISEKLNTGHLNITGTNKPVFLSEALTPKAQKLFYAARQFSRENGYSFCWTSRGLVYLRKVEGEPSICVDTESSLTKLISKK